MTGAVLPFHRPVTELTNLQARASLLLTSFRVLTPILRVAPVIEPCKRRRLVPKAPYIQPALTRNHLDVLVGQVEIPGIAHQGDLAWRRR